MSWLLVVVGATLGSTILAFVSIYALSKTRPTLFQAKPFTPLPKELFAGLLPPDPLPVPDPDARSSLQAEYEQLLAVKHDFCTQWNHSCDVCPRHNLESPSLCSFDEEVTLLINEKATAFDQRMDNLTVLLAKNETLALKLNDNLELANTMIDEQTYIKRRYFYTVVFFVINLLFNAGIWSTVIQYLPQVIP